MELTLADKKIWDMCGNYNASEQKVIDEFKKRKLKLSTHIETIMFNGLGDCHISDHYSTLSKSAKIAVMKHRIKMNIAGNY